MKVKTVLTLVLLAAVALAGCGSDSKEKAAWDYQSGRVIAIQNDQLLVVQSKDVTELELKPELESVDEILTVLRPQAIWLTVTDETDMAGVEVGDDVRVEIEGGVAESYPAQATARKIEKVQSK
ncbi:DUF3221 domain-containing protein [Paenibacillus sp. 1011MAR3C5]|uniref:DUF3221 domain-containing protein n=1 Tax=Paenibacillus sp. 1011MAR3C5 TaxID=1675787 RepID=UPI0015FFF13D|nr:DUF3221 domain-containing protein [Paenibacillus sp. 1011MAR3C5]